MTDQPTTNQPRDWFPGAETGPRVAISVNSVDLEILRDMIDNTRFGVLQIAASRRVLRDLYIREGAIAELTDDDQGLTDEVGARRIAGIPLQPDEFEILRESHDSYRAGRNVGAGRHIDDLFIALDRRYGAAQIKLAGAGGLSDDADFPTQLDEQARAGHHGRRWTDNQQRGPGVNGRNWAY